MTVCGFDEPARCRALPWIRLAALWVGISGLFALLVALARVPAVGAWFPGDDFYRVALTMHVTFSQGAWFIGFAIALLAAADSDRRLARLQWWGAVLASAGMLASLFVGERRSLMSNYFPVLDHALFLWSGAALLMLFVQVSVRAVLQPGAGVPVAGGMPALRVAALQSLVAIGLAVHAAAAMDFEIAGRAGFEALFWAAGHAWQYALVTLMMFCWLFLAGGLPVKPIASGGWMLLLILAAAPTVLSVLAAATSATLSAAYFAAFTDVMRLWSWPAPVALALWMLWSQPQMRCDPGFLIVLALLGGGLFLGTRIAGETTLVTAHYHGTVGAVTLSFMLLAARLVRPEPAGVRNASERGALLYGAGVWLMMAGLAGAGWAGAPRKMAGDLSLTLSIETMSRFVLGVGGLLATLGLLGFAWGIIGNGIRRRHWRARVGV